MSRRILLSQHKGVFFLFCESQNVQGIAACWFFFQVKSYENYNLFFYKFYVEIAELFSISKNQSLSI